MKTTGVPTRVNADTAAVSSASPMVIDLDATLGTARSDKGQAVRQRT